MTEFALAPIFDAIAAQVPERECIVQGARRLHYGEVRDRVARLASWFSAQGLGKVRELAELSNWESGQDMAAIYLHNCPEYLESMLACFRAIAAAGVDRVMPLAPLMHGAAHWVAQRALYRGETVVLDEHTTRFDAHRALAIAERERVQALLIVGDAFGRPLADALASGRHQLPELIGIISGGAPLCTDTKRILLERLPSRWIIDAIGSSESGHQALHISAGTHVHTGRFTPTPTTQVLSADRTRVLGPGDPELGWLAQAGRVPLGYLDDREKTRVTFPVIAGVRWAVPGDRAYVRAGGEIEVVGRDSVTINSGGEKIFVEEVEEVLKRHPAVYDVLVCGRPSARWGQEVCAVVQLRAAAEVSESELVAHAARQLARYKLPRAIVFCERLERSPSGKPDYAWARAQLTGDTKS